MNSATGIDPLDRTIGGGFPNGRITFVDGGPGDGKTVLSLQFLMNGASTYSEPGVFVCFEESIDELCRDARSIGLDLEAAQRADKIVLLQGSLDIDVLQSGTFDLEGLLSIASLEVERIGAKRIVFELSRHRHPCDRQSGRRAA